MKIFWQSFVSQVNGASYLARLQDHLNEMAAPGTEVEVFGMDPPDRDFGRLSELRCGIQAIDAGLGAEEAGYDAFVMGHFQDPGLYELRSALRIPVKGLDAYIADLNAKKYRNARPGIRKKPWGSRDADIADPFGNRLTFYEEIPAP